MRTFRTDKGIIGISTEGPAPMKRPGPAPESISTADLPPKSERKKEKPDAEPAGGVK